MASVCLPSDALLQHLPSYLGFSYLGRGVSPHRTPSDLELGVAPLGPPVPTQPPLIGRGVPPKSVSSNQLTVIHSILWVIDLDSTESLLLLSILLVFLKYLLLWKMISAKLQVAH